MRPVTQLAPSAPAQPPPGRSAPPEASAAPFAAVLDVHRARTAVAEGHTPKRPTGAEDQATTTPATPDARDAAADATTPAITPDARKDDGNDGAAPTPPSTVLVDPTPAALAAVVPVSVAFAAPASIASPAQAPAPATPAGFPVPDAAPAVALPGAPFPGTAPLPGSPLAGAPAPGTPVPGGSPAPTGTGTGAAPQPGTPSPADAPAGIPVPVAADGGDAPAAPTTDATPSADTTATPQGGADQRAGSDAGSGNTPNDAARTTTSAVADALRAAAPAAAHATPADTSAAAAATASTPAPTTTATATVAAPAAPTSSASVPLAQAAETVRLTLSAAARSGVTRARIALRPEELGGVEVHLRHTSEGLSARVVAEVPEAAHLLSQAAGELRRTLEQQGINIVRLDVGTAGDEAAGAGTGAAGREQRDGRRNGGSNAAGDTTETDLPLPERTIELPNGALVDVLA